MKKIDLATVRHGIVCFTFDDRNFAGWTEALPLFEQYNAHVSFFISGALDEETVRSMTVLRDAGHTVGLHTLNHADAPEYFEKYGEGAYYENELLPQLSVCERAGLEVAAFGYPNNRRDAHTDDVLGQVFRRFRAGLTGASEEEIFVPVEKLSGQRVMHGHGVGEYYHTAEEELIGKLRRAAETNTCVTFFSHNIAPDADFIHFPTALLERCLRECEKYGILTAGFDEL